MHIINIIDEDFVNYKKASLFVGFPKCSFKCDKECGKKVCQNSELAHARTINIDAQTIVNRYLKNKFTSAIVFGGLEPMDTFDDLVKLIVAFRKYTNDDIVIYTGYTEDELVNKINCLKNYENIIVKFGRFIPDRDSVLDTLLNVELASDNQYAKQIS